MSKKQSNISSETEELSLREKLGYPKWTGGTDCSKDEPITEQHHAETMDINDLVARYTPKELNDLALNVEQNFMDLTQFDDFQATMNDVARAKTEFEKMPAKIKNKFDNNPARLIQFLGDDKNRAHAEELGLIAKKESPTEPQNTPPGKKTEPKTE